MKDENSSQKSNPGNNGSDQYPDPNSDNKANLFYTDDGELKHETDPINKPINNLTTDLIVYFKDNTINDASVDFINDKNELNMPIETADSTEKKNSSDSITRLLAQAGMTSAV